MGLLSRKSRTKDVSDPAKLLIAEHQKVERLFEQLDAAGGAVERQALVAQLDAELSAHTAKEETILYPFVAKRVPKGDTMIYEANREHGLAKQALADLVSMDPGDAGLLAVAARLRGLVKAHVKEEEKVLFPALAKAAGAGDLATLRAQLETAKFTPVQRPLDDGTRSSSSGPRTRITKKSPAKRTASTKPTAKKPAATRTTAATRKAAAKKATATRATATRKAAAKRTTTTRATTRNAAAKRAR